MRISDAEVKKIITSPGKSIVEEIEQVARENVQHQDRLMVDSLKSEIAAMPDREAMIEELRAQISAGLYNPTGSEIVEAMLRRAIADQYGQ